MPLYSGFTQKRRRILLITAGKDTFRLTNVLGNTVNIEAILNDTTNLENVKIEWEQTAGQPVVLSSLDTLSTSYVDGDNSDKTFTIYLDRGTNREQKKDITFYKTPTSTSKAVNGVVSKTSFVSQTIPNLRFETGTTIPPVQGVFIESVNILSGYGISFDPTSIPDLAGNATKIRLWGAVGVKSYVHPQLIAEEVAVDGVIPTFFIVPEGSYSVEIEYKRGSTRTYRSPTIFMEPVEIAVKTVGTDDVMHVNKSGVVGRAYNLKRFFFSKQIEETAYTVKGGVSGKTYNLVRFKNVKLNDENNPLAEDSKIFANKSGTSLKLSNLVRLNPSNIGSSQ